MDFGVLGHIDLTWDFFSGFLSIVLINLILSGDNAVVIALAVRSLPRAERIKGIIFGSALAVVLRIVLTFFAAQLLQVSYLKLIGGVLIAWIAVRLFLEDTEDRELKKEARGLTQALRIILMADLIMSLDNVLAVAAASRGNLFLLMTGLAMSIPIVVGTSTLLSRLMDRFPVIIYIGAAVLGKVAGDMVMSDPFMVRTFSPGAFATYSVEALFTVGVVVTGKLCARFRRSREEAALQSQKTQGG